MAGNIPFPSAGGIAQSGGAASQDTFAQQAHRGSVPRLDAGHRRDIQLSAYLSYDYAITHVIRWHMEPIMRLLIAAEEGHTLRKGERLSVDSELLAKELKVNGTSGKPFLMICGRSVPRCVSSCASNGIAMP